MDYFLNCCLLNRSQTFQIQSQLMIIINQGALGGREREKLDLLHSIFSPETVQSDPMLLSQSSFSLATLPPPPPRLMVSAVSLFRRTVVCPIIDVISDDTFEYMAGSDMTYGGFNWKLNFRWYPVPQREMDRRKGDRTLPVR